MALDPTVIENAIEANIQQAKRTRYGSREVEQHDLGDQAELLDRVSPASDQPHFGLRLTKLVSPGCG